MRAPCIISLLQVVVVLLLAAIVAAGENVAASFPRDTDAILEELSRRSFRWFQRNRHPQTGLVLDRAPADESSQVNPKAPAAASIASVGYFLSLLPEAVRLGYLPEDLASQQAQETLQFVLHHGSSHRGLMRHFIDWRSGKTWRDSEVSTLDSAILLNGAMTAAEAFGDPVRSLADSLLDRADWAAFLVEMPGKGRLLALGWSPERGLLGPIDVRSSEAAMAYFLAVGSKTHPIDADCWYRTRIQYLRLEGERLLNARHPLFTAVYGLGWHDLEGLKDKDGVDLFANARLAALTNRAYCRRIGIETATYSRAHGWWWGISAGDSPSGYIAVGPGTEEGTVWPMAALATLPFISKELKRDLRRWRNSDVWALSAGDFGLAPFQLNDEFDWGAREQVGIDLGSAAVAISNYRHRTIWDLWMRHKVARAAVARLGYTKAK
jgi:hypothetical protein